MHHDLASNGNIFEAGVYRRLSFPNEASDEIDKYNGGFSRDSRPSDNLFVLNGLIEKPLVLGKSLVACFVVFSNAFDVINRNILIYKLVNNGWKGLIQTHSGAFTTKATSLFSGMINWDQPFRTGQELVREKYLVPWCWPIWENIQTTNMERVCCKHTTETIPQKQLPCSAAWSIESSHSEPDRSKSGRNI